MENPHTKLMSEMSKRIEKLEELNEALKGLVKQHKEVSELKDTYISMLRGELAWEKSRPRQ